MLLWRNIEFLIRKLDFFSLNLLFHFLDTFVDYLLLFFIRTWKWVFYLAITFAIFIQLQLLFNSILVFFRHILAINFRKVIISLTMIFTNHQFLIDFLNFILIKTSQMISLRTPYTLRNCHRISQIGRAHVWTPVTS